MKASPSGLAERTSSVCILSSFSIDAVGWDLDSRNSLY